MAPAQTVCNLFNYWTTFLTEHITERDQVGFNQRVMIIGMPSGDIGVELGGVPIVVPGGAKAPMAGYSGIQSNGIRSDGVV